MNIKEKLVGREAEKLRLDEALESSDPELIAIYGRRRVGKTFLVRKHLQNDLVFELAGLNNAPMHQQLENCRNELIRQFPGKYITQISSWLEAFELLRSLLEESRNQTGRKTVLFFDEFPWLATRRSGYLGAFENFWNSYASRRHDLVVIICGSAASWMIKKVIGTKGGLHSRVTGRIRLEPFRLGEAKRYLTQRKVRLDNYQLCQIYMAMGGIPQYLKQIRPGESAAQSIDRLCFAKDGLLSDEYRNLYAALFDKPAHHESVIRALASRRSGLSRNELLAAADLRSGGAASTVIEELVQSGFVHESPPKDNKRKGFVYRLADEYSLFYLHWIKNNRTTGKNIWLQMSSTRKYDTWCGYAFETLCLKHVSEIKKALNIGAVQTSEYSWYCRPASEQDEGAQIDLVIERRDHCINLCEMKFSRDPFTITKRYATDLERKLRVFQNRTKTRHTLFLTLVTSQGLKRNTYSEQLVSSEVTLGDLMR